MTSTQDEQAPAATAAAAAAAPATTTTTATKEEATCTAPIRNLRHLDGKMPWGEERDESRTCLSMLLEHAARTPDAPCLGGRHHEKAPADGSKPKLEDRFRWQSYASTRDHVLAMALGMRQALGLAEGARLAVFAPCSVRCFEMSLVASALRCAIVPVNENNNPEGIAIVVRNSGAVAAVVAAQEGSETVRAFDELLPGHVVLLKPSRKKDADPAAPAHPTLSDMARAGRATDEYRAFVDAVKAATDASDARQKEQPQKEEAKEKEQKEEPYPVTEAEAEERKALETRRRNDDEAVKAIVEAWPLPMPAMEDLCIVMYTSGTTGTPKGVMLTQANLTAGVAAFHGSIGERLWQKRRWVYFNMLPLAHIYGVAVSYVLIRLGGAVGFFSGDRSALLAEIQMVRPVVIAAVPRVYQKLYEGITGKISGMAWYKRALFWAAYAWRRSALNSGGYFTYADGVFAAIRKQFGGEVAIALNGGAPIPRDICEFFHVTLTHEFYDGYGMTETTAAGIRSQSCDTLDNIGLLTPFYNTEMKILSVPEMGYLATDEPPRGELLIRGPQIACLGYYNDAAATRQAFDDEGYVHTGDIVALVQPSKVRIIDRRKNMFKLAQGEYVSGESIEGTLQQSPYIESVFVHGDSTQPYPVAIVVPSTAVFDWAAAHAADDPELARAAESRDMHAICESSAVRDMIVADIARVSRAAGLKGYEVVHHIHLHDTPFDEARNMVSASLKLKRHVLKQYFATELAQLAQENH